MPTLGSYLGSGPAVAVFQRGHLGGFVLGFLISEQGEEEHVPCSWDESWSELQVVPVAGEKDTEDHRL